MKCRMTNTKKKKASSIARNVLFGVSAMTMLIQSSIFFFLYNRNNNKFRLPAATGIGIGGGGGITSPIRTATTTLPPPRPPPPSSASMKKSSTTLTTKTATVTTKKRGAPVWKDRTYRRALSTSTTTAGSSIAGTGSTTAGPSSTYVIRQKRDNKLLALKLKFICQLPPFVYSKLDRYAVCYSIQLWLEREYLMKVDLVFKLKNTPQFPHLKVGTGLGGKLVQQCFQQQQQQQQGSQDENNNNNMIKTPINIQEDEELIIVDDGDGGGRDAKKKNDKDVMNSNNGDENAAVDVNDNKVAANGNNKPPPPPHHPLLLLFRIPFLHQNITSTIASQHDPDILDRAFERLYVSAISSATMRMLQQQSQQQQQSRQQQQQQPQQQQQQESESDSDDEEESGSESDDDDTTTTTTAAHNKAEPSATEQDDDDQHDSIPTLYLEESARSPFVYIDRYYREIQRYMKCKPECIGVTTSLMKDNDNNNNNNKPIVLQPPGDDETLLYLGLRTLNEFNKSSTAALEYEGLYQYPQQVPLQLFNATIGPQQIAHTVLGHLHENDKVVVVSRANVTDLEPYMAALRQRKMKVRHASLRTAIHEYCFVAASKKEMIGASYEDSFVLAGLLSDTAQRVVIFDHQSTTQPKRKSHGSYHKWKYSPPELASKLVWWDFVQQPSPLLLDDVDDDEEDNDENNSNT